MVAFPRRYWIPSGRCHRPAPSTCGVVPINSFNTADAILIALILVAAIDGLRRGFILGVLDFVALSASLGLALAYHRPLAAFLVDGVDVQVGTASAMALAGIFGGAVIVFAVLGTILSRTIEIADWVTRAGLLNTLAGTIPGIVKGGIVALVAIHAGLLLPQTHSLLVDLRSSEVAQRVDGAFTQAAPFVMGPLDQIASEAPQFVPLIRPGERKDLAIPKGVTTSPDRESEATMLRLLNQERALAGIPPLVSDDILRSVAGSHSEEMFQLGYFSHESPIGGSPADRVRRAGARYAIVAENLAYAPTVEVAHRSLMGSPEHRRNILSPELKRVGIGVEQSGVWGRMFTQSFTD